jgi:Carbohydrate esterase 2 N-terminal/GDSL-like Lipase/Acylhydrolase family
MKPFFIAAILCIIVQTAFTQSIIKSNDPHIHYMGRVRVNADSAELSWSGNSITINFKGTGVKALLRDQSGINYFKVIVDGQVLPDIQIDSAKRLYTLVSGLPEGVHQLELFKRTEWVFGKTWLYQLELDANTIIAKAPATKKRKIEFYGNSITCGYAVLDTTGKDRGTAPFEDNYLGYAAITARHFNAEYNCIARSGIGILISWFPQIMSEMYDRLNGVDSTSTWDFSQYKPDVVVINLFQNDSWLVVQHQYPEFKHRFDTTAPKAAQIIAAYQSFVKSIRSRYPKTQIICALGSMDATKEGSAWPGYISKAVENLGDKKITTHFFPYKNTPGHPSKAEQQIMADDLINYIETNIKW